MARLSRLVIPGLPQHVIQRGNNRQACFLRKNVVAGQALNQGYHHAFIM